MIDWLAAATDWLVKLDSNPDAVIKRIRAAAPNSTSVVFDQTITGRQPDNKKQIKSVHIDINVAGLETGEKIEISWNEN